MSVGLTIDSRDFRELQVLMLRVPAEIKAKAFSRALRRVRGMAKTVIVREAAKDSGMRNRDVAKVTAAFNTGSNTAKIVVKSGWMPLYGLGGARQTRSGVSVRKWGSHKGAFIATMRSGHTGIFVRIKGTRMEKKNKEQIRELWGPNPVSYILKEDRKYLKILTRVMEDRMVPRVYHELDRILGLK